jgi:hypothetical protein
MMCKGSVALGTGCMKCASCEEEVAAGVKPFDHASQPRPMLPIPISAAERIAKDYGYDQVVVMARRISNPLPPINPMTANPDDGISGEHITTYGVNTTHCAVAAMMGDTLKDIAGWPERADFDLVREMYHELLDGQIIHSDYDRACEMLGALRRILYPRERDKK